LLLIIQHTHKDPLHIPNTSQTHAELQHVLNHRYAHTPQVP
jgi:hypothetical protein